MNELKYGDWFCTKCIGVVAEQRHDNCNYDALWIDSPLKKEIADQQATIQKLAEALEQLKILLALKGVKTNESITALLELANEHIK